MTEQELVKQWLQPGAIVPVDANTTRILITALRERLAQPEQIPPSVHSNTHQPEQEPVATVRCINGITIGYLEVMQPVGTKLYTTPPQRTWVGLTATEVHETEGYEEDRKLYRFARAIEAKLREKNT